MRYFKLVTYTTGDEYETRERLIDEPTFRQYQKAMIEGQTVLVLEDRVIKTSMIKEILPADDEVKEYLAMGTGLARLGLPENPRLGVGISEVDGRIGNSKYDELKAGFTKQTEMS